MLHGAASPSPLTPAPSSPLRGCGIDIDDTIADTSTYWMTVACQHFGIPNGTSIATLVADFGFPQKVPYWDSETVHLYMRTQRTPEHLLSIPPIPGAVESITRIFHQRPQSTYITARGTEELEVTQQWLQRNGFPAGRVICRPESVAPDHAATWKREIFQSLSAELDLIIDNDPRNAIAVDGISFVLFGRKRDEGPPVISGDNWSNTLRVVEVLNRRAVISSSRNPAVAPESFVDRLLLTPISLNKENLHEVPSQLSAFLRIASAEAGVDVELNPKDIVVLMRSPLPVYLFRARLTDDTGGGKAYGLWSDAEESCVLIAHLHNRFSSAVLGTEPIVAESSEGLYRLLGDKFEQAYRDRQRHSMLTGMLENFPTPSFGLIADEKQLLGLRDYFADRLYNPPSLNFETLSRVCGVILKGCRDQIEQLPSGSDLAGSLERGILLGHNAGLSKTAQVAACRSAVVQIMNAFDRAIEHTAVTRNGLASLIPSDGLLSREPAFWADRSKIILERAPHLRRAAMPLDTFLVQFDLPDRNLAVRLVEAIDFVDRDTMLALLKTLHAKLGAQGVTPLNSYFTYLGVAKSGGVIGYQYRQANGLDFTPYLESKEDVFADLKELRSRTAIPPHRENLVILDDCAIRGYQAQRTLTVYESVLAQFRRVIFCPVFSTPGLTFNAGGHVIDVLSVRDVRTVENSPHPLDREEVAKLNERYRHRAPPFVPKDSNTLTIFEHNTPASTVPVLCRTTASWSALFPRRNTFSPSNDRPL